MKWWIAGMMVVMLPASASAGDCQALRDAVIPALAAVDRADLSLVAIGGSFNSRKMSKQVRQEIRAAAERVLAWSHEAIVILEFTAVAGCEDAIGARGLRAAAEDLHTDAERLLAKIPN